jgi:RIO kinase 2
MHMSRLAALKEYTFMRSLRDTKFPVPEPVAWNRHIVVMEMINGFPMRMVESVPEPAKLYGELIELMLRLAKHGLIHGDYNEFNILLEEQEREDKPELITSTVEADSEDNPDFAQPMRQLSIKPIIIDFPQMVSIQHSNAQFYFDRDVACIKRYFERRYHFVSDEAGPFFADATKMLDPRRLDVEAEASGFSRKMAKELEGYMRDVGVDGDANGEAAAGENEGEEDDEEEEEFEGAADLAQNDLAVQAPDLDVVDGMPVLKLSDDSLSQAFPTAPSAADGASLIEGGKPRVNSAKAAKGWII